MKIIEKRFRFVAPDQWDGVVGFCSYGFAKLFDVPVDIKTVWLSLHDRPAVNREPVVVENGKELWGPGAAQIRLGNLRQVFSVESLDKVLFPFIGKTLYLQCEYEV